MTTRDLMFWIVVCTSSRIGPSEFDVFSWHCYEIVHDLIEKCNAQVSSTAPQVFPSQILEHLCHAMSSIKVGLHKSSSSSLDLLQGILILDKVWVPH